MLSFDRFRLFYIKIQSWTFRGKIGDVDLSEAKVFKEHAIPESETASGEGLSDLSRELLADACPEEMDEEDSEEIDREEDDLGGEDY